MATQHESLIILKHSNSYFKRTAIFEKHVGVANEKYSLNKYSANPDQALEWLKSAKRAFEACGGLKYERKGFTKKKKRFKNTL